MEVKFAVPQDETVEVCIETEALADGVMSRLIEDAVKRYVVNSTNSAQNRFKADPTTGAPDYAKVAKEAKDRLLNDKMRARRGEGAPAKEAKDPVDAIVTVAVCRDLFESRRRTDTSTKWFSVTNEVGNSGIAYLEALADGNPTKLKKMADKYIRPAQKMLGLNAKGESEAGEDDDLI